MSDSIGRAIGHWHTTCELVEAREEIQKLRSENERLRGEIQKWIHYYGLGSSPLFQRVEQAEARVAALEAALGKLLGELSDLQIEAVREGCGNTNAACLRLRVDEARAALTEPTPPAGGQG